MIVLKNCTWKYCSNSNDKLKNIFQRIEIGFNICLDVITDDNEIITYPNMINMSDENMNT